MIESVPLPTDIALPAWASFVPGEGPGTTAKRNGRWEVIVDADAMYEAGLAAFRSLYPNLAPADASSEIVAGEVPANVKADTWPACHAELHAERPTNYWLETVHQWGKLTLQVALRTFEANLLFKSATKKYAQSKHDDGVLGAKGAAGGVAGGRDARHHFKNLTGFFPG